jgi:hypothetical protein
VRRRTEGAPPKHAGICNNFPEPAGKFATDQQNDDCADNLKTVVDKGFRENVIDILDGCEVLAHERALGKRNARKILKGLQQRPGE